MNTQDTSLIPDLSHLINDPNASITKDSPPKKTSHHQSNHNKNNKALLIAILLFFLITLPVIAVFVAQRQQIGDIRQRAAYPNQPCSPNGTEECTNNILYRCINGRFVAQGACNQCFVDNPSVTNSYITISNCPDQYPLSTYWSEAPPGTSDSSCVGTSANGSTQMVGNGTYRPDGPCGRCVQIDVVVNGQNYGTAKYTGDCPTPTNAPTPTNPPQPTNTPTPTLRSTNTPTPNPTNTSTPTNTPVAGQCSNIKIYRNGVVVDPNTLQPGNSIVIAVVGTNATQARILINDARDWIVSSQRNAQGEWIFNYTIPTDGTRTFSIVGQLLIGNIWR